MNKTPYALADKAIALLNRKAIIRFQKAKQRMQRAGFDELNVISACQELYTGLDRDNRQAYLNMAQMTYKRAKPNGKEEPDWPFIFMWLDGYNEVTRYVYTHEVDRKRAYVQEALLSTSTQRGRSEALQKGLRYWANMSGQYADIITDQSMLKAYRDAGVQYVMWVTEQDEKVCSICRPLDGKVYPIDNVPKKQHWHCRCYLVSCDRWGHILTGNTT